MACATAYRPFRFKAGYENSASNPLDSTSDSRACRHTAVLALRPSHALLFVNRAYPVRGRRYRRKKVANHSVQDKVFSRFWQKSADPTRNDQFPQPESLGCTRSRR